MANILDTVIPQTRTKQANGDDVYGETDRTPEWADHGATIATLNLQPTEPAPKRPLQKAADDILARGRNRRL